MLKEAVQLGRTPPRVVRLVLGGRYWRSPARPGSFWRSVQDVAFQSWKRQLPAAVVETWLSLNGMTARLVAKGLFARSQLWKQWESTAHDIFFPSCTFPAMSQPGKHFGTFHQLVSPSFRSLSLLCAPILSLTLPLWVS